MNLWSEGMKLKNILSGNTVVIIPRSKDHNGFGCYFSDRVLQ